MSHETFGPHALHEPYKELFEMAVKGYSCDALDTTQFIDADNKNFDPCTIDVSPDGNPLIGVDAHRFSSLMMHSFTRILKLAPGSANKPARWFRPAIFAHQLGHAIQMDPLTAETFGPVNLAAVSLDKHTLKEFDNSERELHAHFITATLLGATSVGNQFGLMPNRYSDLEWNQWAENRKFG